MIKEDIFQSRLGELSGLNSFIFLEDFIFYSEIGRGRGVWRLLQFLLFFRNFNYVVKILEKVSRSEQRINTAVWI